VSASADRLALSVSDDGRGGASLADSRGLRGLADRVEAAGGALSGVSAEMPAR
jgi:signal transduction histidine kinase